MRKSAWMRPRDAWRLLGCCRATIYNLANTGRVRSLRFANGGDGVRMLVNKTDVEKLREEGYASKSRAAARSAA